MCYYANLLPYCSHRILQAGEELIRFVHAEAERGKQTDDIGSAYTCKDFLLEEQFRTQLFNRLFKFQPYHQTTSAHFLDALETLQFF